MNKKITIINSSIYNYLTEYFKNTDIEVSSNISGDEDLIVYENFLNELPKNGVNIHQSLLPAFKCENPIEEAYLNGVKVSGITIHNNNKIIAQYPVLIGIDTHLNEFKQDIIDIEKRLVPTVIESILEDRVFDFQDIFKSPCAHKGGCTGCNSCH